MKIPEPNDPDNPGRMSCARLALIDIRQTAEMLGLSERSIYRRVKAGDMPPPVKIGSLTRWRLDDICTWYAEGCPAASRKERG